MEAYVADLPVDAAMRKVAARDQRHGAPYCRARRITIRYETLLDAIVDYLPSPLDRPAVLAHGDDGDVLVTATDRRWRRAGVQGQPSGAWRARLRACVRRAPACERPGLAQRHRQGAAYQPAAVLRAGDTEAVEMAEAGEIVAVTRLEGREYRRNAGRARPAPAPGSDPHPARGTGLALSPSAKADLLRLGTGLRGWRRKNPSFRVGSDPDTGETVVQAWASCTWE